MVKTFILFCVMCVPGRALFCQAGFTLTLTGVPDAAKLTLVRETPAKAHYVVDTFTRQSKNTAVLTLFDIRSPAVGWLMHTGDTIRQIFMVPGHQASIALQPSNTTGRFLQTPFATGVNLAVAGSSAAMQVLFDDLVKSAHPAFINDFAKASEKHRNKLLDSALKAAGKLDQAYRPLMEFNMRKLILTAVDSSKAILSLNDAQTLYLPYYKTFAYPSFKTDVDQHYQAQLNALLAQQEGHPAFDFILPDTAGAVYRLSDFKGKVVYLDLWASWCLPCRLESAHLQKLSKRFRNRNDLVFIGIAVGDNVKDWKKALRQDHPTWLQLRDNSNLIANAYAVRSLPRYVLINKAGNVAGYFAPAPSEATRITALIEKELKN